MIQIGQTLISHFEKAWKRRRLKTARPLQPAIHSKLLRRTGSNATEGGKAEANEKNDLFPVKPGWHHKYVSRRNIGCYSIGKDYNVGNLYGT